MLIILTYQAIGLHFTYIASGLLYCLMVTNKGSFQIEYLASFESCAIILALYYCVCAVRFAVGHPLLAGFGLASLSECIRIIVFY